MERSRKFLLRPFHVRRKMKQSVYIVGSKGIPAKYGGFETFVEKLTECQQDREIQYYVACMRENSAKSNITADTFEHNGAICYNIDVLISVLHVLLLMILQLSIKLLKSQKKTRIKPLSSMFWHVGSALLSLVSRRKSRRSEGL